MDKEAIFIYNGISTTIQCKKNEKMEDICKRYANKVGININDSYFLYGGENIDLTLSYEETIDEDDLNRGKMSILIYQNNNNSNTNENNQNISKIKSKYIICPKCEEHCLLNIKDYKIFLYGCKSKHNTENILLNEYDNTQYINESKIKCNDCNENKSQTYNKQFFKCLTCNINLCPLCNTKHNKDHQVIDYDKKNLICNIHKESYNSYCEKCKINLCMFCEENHNNHRKNYYGGIIPNKNAIEEGLKEFRTKIDKMNEKINNIINLLKKISDYMEIYYKINNDILNNYDLNNRNYQIFQNINQINENIKIEDLDNLLNDNNIESQFNILLSIYDKMNNRNENLFKEEENNNILKGNIKKEIKFNHQSTKENSNINNIITIKYKININEVKIFGKEFVNNNKDNCLILYKNKKYHLTEFLLINKLIKDEEIFEIKLEVINNLINLGDMFDNCDSLYALTDISNLNTSNVEQMNGMFRGCSSLCELDDISNWDTSNVKDMNGMFNGCKSLSSLPDISKWDTSNVTNMGWMFYNCKSLKSLPDISKWNIDNVINKEWMFERCKKNILIPNKFKK